MKGFLFDLDNTLYDRYATLRAICESDTQRLLPWLNPGYTLERAIEHLLHTEPLYIPHGWKPVYRQLVAEHFFNADNTPSWEEFAAFIVEGMSRVAVPFPFTVPVLKELMICRSFRQMHPARFRTQANRRCNKGFYYQP